MILYPSLPIKDGTVSCLSRSSSDTDQAALVDPHPVERAIAFEAEGFEWLHIVDLDAAFSESPVNVQCIEDMIRAVRIPVQISGGMHSMRAIETWIERGAQSVVLTSAAQNSPELVREAAARFPGRIAVRIDSIRGFVARTGWHATAPIKALDLALRAEEAGAAAIIYADINSGGALSDVNMEATVDLAFALTVPVIAAGGGLSLQELAALKAYGPAGVAGLIVDSPLYNGEINVRKALELARA